VVGDACRSGFVSRSKRRCLPSRFRYLHRSDCGFYAGFDGGPSTLFRSRFRYLHHSNPRTVVQRVVGRKGVGLNPVSGISIIPTAYLRTPLAERGLGCSKGATSTRAPFCGLSPRAAPLRCRLFGFPKPVSNQGWWITPHGDVGTRSSAANVAEHLGFYLQIVTLLKAARPGPGPGLTDLEIVVLANFPYRQQTHFVENAFNLLIRLLRDRHCGPAHGRGDGHTKLVHR
jgi:hypothetical protein